MSKALKNVHVIVENQEESKGPTITQTLEASKGLKPAEHTKKVPLCEDVPYRTVIIGQGLEQVEEELLIQFLRNNQDVFAWSSVDLKGVSRGIMEHALNVDPKFKPVKQRLWTMYDDRKKESHSSRSSKAARGRGDRRSAVLRLACKML